MCRKEGKLKQRKGKAGRVSKKVGRGSNVLQQVINNLLDTCFLAEIFVKSLKALKFPFRIDNLAVRISLTQAPMKTVKYLSLISVFEDHKAGIRPSRTKTPVKFVKYMKRKAFRTG